MIKKCDANCDAKKGVDTPRLWLRNKMFYSIIELPRVNGKRRYKRLSLHTSNFYEARERLNQMADLNILIDRLRMLYSGLIFVQKPSLPGNYMGLGCVYGSNETLSDLNKPQDVAELLKLHSILSHQYNEMTEQNKQLMQRIGSMEKILKDFVEKFSVPISAYMLNERQKPLPSLQPKHTIKDMINSMLLKANTNQDTASRKRNTLKKLLKDVNLTENDDYSKFHDINVIQKISENIITQNKIGNGTKKKNIGYIKELVLCASNVDPNFYPSNVIANLPNIKKVKKSERKFYVPYSRENLLNIFDPKHDHFKKDPDCFWICMIALFTGARANAALTLQYDDIIHENDMYLIHFQLNHKIKKFKNEASERKVPIHKQLLDLGFVDYIKKKKIKNKASGSDFIFPGCITKGNKYNNKYMIRKLFPFFKELKIKKDNNDGFGFHSFRKNVSNAMQDALIPQSYINDIIGWEGKGTMELFYSNHTPKQIKEQMDTFEYEFLKPHFEKWKDIMAEK